MKSHKTFYLVPERNNLYRLVLVMRKRKFRGRLHKIMFYAKFSMDINLEDDYTAEPDDSNI